ncbi:type II toxin-antitoxin system prevent-host-death family antitoxin [Cellulomonas sp. P5_C5]
MTSREFNHDVSAAKRAARSGPVVITDRGVPSHVLVTFDDFERMTGPHCVFSEALRMDDATDIEFDPPRVAVSARPADL